MKMVGRFFIGGFVLFSASLAHAGIGSGSRECGGRIKYQGLAYNYRCEHEDYLVRPNHDGIVAWLQGHARGTDGEISYGENGMMIDMDGHKRGSLCCKGKGVVVGAGSNASAVGSKNIVIRGGYFLGKSGVFVMGEPFEDQETKWQDIDEDIQKEEYEHVNYERCSSDNDNIVLNGMVLKGESGDVHANNSSIIGSRLAMHKVWVSGLNFTFKENFYMVVGSVFTDQGSRVYPVRVNAMVSIVDSLPVIYSGINNAKPRQHFNPITALYLSCADGANIANNTFTARTKKTSAYAIVLKHSKNVRITNNTFEGFDVPILMDKYSSIIDDRGNIIKPEVTINSSRSRLYNVDLDHVQGDAGHTWWKFWQ